ncbi:hypothetical protein DVK02_08560 [Halobellus sp. Atlit-31R]|nr:hypothetical protein DVK02_08560 [Halobellus sp. Atlit-31R]
MRAGDICPECKEGYIGVETLPIEMRYCPNCEWFQAAGTSSVRAGDICPECKKGYVTARER